MQSLIDYIQTLPITQGDHVGECVVLMPWQRKFIRGAFGPGVSTSCLSLGRANGKTSLIAMLCTAALDGPLAQPRSEILLVASSLSQAKICYNHVLAMLGKPKADRKRWKTLDSPQKAEIQNLANGVILRCISSKPQGAHGAAPVLVICDEVAQWGSNTRDEMKAALETSLGKIDGARMLAIGTQSDDESCWFQSWLKGAADYIQLHAASESDYPHHKRTWRKANPSLDHLPSLASAIARDSEKAKTDADALAMFKSLRLNMPTPDTVRAELLTPAELQLLETEDLPAPAGNPVWGVDLGATAAMSAVACYHRETGRLEVLAALPSIPSLADRGAYDGVGDAYTRMYERGELIITEGRTVDVAELFETAIERFGFPIAVAGDRWRQGDLLDAMDALGLSAEFVARGMGFKDGAEDVRGFRQAVLERKVRLAPSLLMRSALSGARVVSDTAGNQKLAKSGDGAGRKSRHRDDACAAAILAVAHGQRQPPPKPFTGYIGLAG